MENKIFRCIRSYPSSYGYDIFSKGKFYCVTITDQKVNTFRTEGDNARTTLFEIDCFKKIFGNIFKYGK